MKVTNYWCATSNGWYNDAVHDPLPEGAMEVSDELYFSLLGKAIETGPDGLPRERLATFEQRCAALLTAVDTHLNSAAQAKGYDSIVTAALRAALPDSPFHAEGVAFGTWMDAVYAKCYQIMAAVQSGEIPEPTIGALLSALPALQLAEPSATNAET